MPISIRLSPQEEKTIREFAKFHGLSVSEFIRQSVFEKIVDELDLKEYKKAKAEYLADPVTHSLDEVEQMLAKNAATPRPIGRGSAT